MTRTVLAISAAAALAAASTASADTLTLQVGNRIDTHTGVVVQIQQANVLARVDFGSTGYTSSTSKVQPPPGIGNWTVVVNGYSYACELTATQYTAQHEIALSFGCAP